MAKRSEATKERGQAAGQPPERERSRAARAAIWTAKATGKVAWGGVKLIGKGLWWSAKTGYKVGKRAGERRRDRRTGQEPPR